MLAWIASLEIKKSQLELLIHIDMFLMIQLGLWDEKSHSFHQVKTNVSISIMLVLHSILSYLVYLNRNKFQGSAM